MTLDLRKLAIALRTWGTGMQLAAMTSADTATARSFAQYALEMEAAAMRCEAAAAGNATEIEAVAAALERGIGHANIQEAVWLAQRLRRVAALGKAQAR